MEKLSMNRINILKTLLRQEEEKVVKLERKIFEMCKHKPVKGERPQIVTVNSKGKQYQYLAKERWDALAKRPSLEYLGRIYDDGEFSKISRELTHRRRIVNLLRELIEVYEKVE